MNPLLAEQEALAADRLPADVLSYYASGAGDGVTTREASAAWLRYRLRPKVLRDVAAVDLTTDLLGTRFASPVGLAPTAFQRLAHPDGELASAAAASGVPFVLSTRSSTRVEDVAAVASPWWFQVYVMRDRALTAALVERAAAAGASALVLTGDAPVLGRKHAVAGERIVLSDSHFGVNLLPHLPSGTSGPALRAAAAQDPAATLADIAWLSGLSGLPVLVKGVLRGDDALACLDAGAAGVVVSTHGGRQLDRAAPSAVALPEVADAVGGRAPVLVDGGIRCGTDVLVALALGASGVLLGRPVLWALAADGRSGVSAMLAALDEDLRRALALAGARTPADLDRSFVTTA